MGEWVLNECLQQLIKVYALAEQQYVHAAIGTTVPVLKKFYEHRALQRMGFIDEVRRTSRENRNGLPFRTTIEQLFEEHNEIYGKDVLNNLLVTDIDSLLIDEKALEICYCLLEDALPANLSRLLTYHSIKMESGIVSMTHLRAQYGS